MTHAPLSTEKQRDPDTRHRTDSVEVSSQYCCTLRRAPVAHTLRKLIVEPMPASWVRTDSPAAPSRARDNMDRLEQLAEACLKLRDELKLTLLI